MQPSQSPRKLSLTKSQRHQGQHQHCHCYFALYGDLSRLLCLRLNIGAIGGQLRCAAVCKRHKMLIVTSRQSLKTAVNIICGERISGLFLCTPDANPGMISARNSAARQTDGAHVPHVRPFSGLTVRRLAAIILLFTYRIQCIHG